MRKRERRKRLNTKQSGTDLLRISILNGLQKSAYIARYTTGSRQHHGELTFAINKLAGWIKIHREITDHWLWPDDRKFKWWIDLLLMANYENGKMLKGNNLIECDRGQLVRSLDGLSRRWMVTKKTVRSFLLLLQDDDMIRIENVKFCTRITICNYDKYQETVNDHETISKRSGNDKETITTPIKEIKKKEEVKNKNKNIPENEFSGLHKTSIKIFTDWYENKIGVKYPFQGADAKAMQTVIVYLKKAITEKNGIEARPDEILTGWRVILESFEKWDSFYQGQLKITQISSNLTNILANIKGIKQNGRIATIRREREQAVNDFAENCIRAAKEVGFK